MLPSASSHTRRRHWRSVHTRLARRKRTILVVDVAVGWIDYIYIREDQLLVKNDVKDLEFMPLLFIVLQVIIGGLLISQRHRAQSQLCTDASNPLLINHEVEKQVNI